MEVNYAFFCDAATSDSSGKLNVLGIFENITFSQFPATHARMSYVFSFKSDRFDMGFKHTAKIQLVKPNSNTAVLAQEFTVSGTGTINLIVNLENIIFDTAGLYDMNLYINGELLKRTSLMVSAHEKRNTSKPH